MELILPSVEYKTSFIQAVKEFQSDSDTTIRTKAYRDLSIAELENNFESYITVLNSHARGENLPKGYVPSTQFWLIDHGMFIGRIDVRHRLTEYLEKTYGHIGYDIRPSERGKGYGAAILKLALQKAKELGIPRILLACLTTNIGSRKIIEKNGGVLENETTDPNSGDKILRFWIEII